MKKQEFTLEKKSKGFPMDRTIVNATGLRCFAFSEKPYRKGTISGEIWVRESFLAEHGDAARVVIEFTGE